MKMKKYALYILVCLLFVGVVLAECNEENIKLFLNENKKEIVREVNQNVDGSFKSYESFNSAQLADFTLNWQDHLKKYSTIYLVAMAGLVSFVSAFWNLILTKRLRKSLTLMSEYTKTNRDILLGILKKKDIDIEKLAEELSKGKKKKGLFGRKEPEEKKEEVKLVKPEFSF
jgi:hypothetical protein